MNLTRNAREAGATKQEIAEAAFAAAAVRAGGTADLTAETKSSTPQELAAMLDKEEKLVVPLIKKLGIKAE